MICCKDENPGWGTLTGARLRTDGHNRKRLSVIETFESCLKRKIIGTESYLSFKTSLASTIVLNSFRVFEIGSTPCQQSFPLHGGGGRCAGVALFSELLLLLPG